MVMAVGMGLALPSATESIMGSVPKEKAGVGSAMNDTTRQAGSALGVAVLGSILVSGYQSQLRRGIASLSLPAGTAARSRESIGKALADASRLGGHVGTALTHAARDAWVHGMNVSTFVAATMVLGAGLLALAYLPAHAEGHHLNASEILPVDMVIDDDQLDAAPSVPGP